MQCNVYFRNQEKGEYLCLVVMAAAALGEVKHLSEIQAVADANGADVLLVEYQANDPDLDNWIARSAGQPEGPEIFLFMDEVSLPVIWQAIKLGAREIFSHTIPAEDFQEALARIEWRQAWLRSRHDAVNTCSRPATEKPGLGGMWQHLEQIPHFPCST